MRKISDQSKENSTLLLKVLLGIMISMVLGLTLYRDFDRDELEAVHTSWKLLNGEQIYVDFFQHHHPFFYYSISPIICLIGENTTTLFVLRFQSFVFFLGMLWCTFRIVDLVFDNNKVSWLAAFLLASTTMFSQKAIEIRPDVPQVLLGLLAILFLLQYVYRSSRYMFFLSSICLGLSFLFLQKTIFIVAGLGLIQLYLIYYKRLTFKQLFIYWACFGVSICPYYLCLIFNGNLHNYFFWNWTLNMHFEESFSAFRTIVDSFYYNHFIWLFYVIGVVICFKRGINILPILSLLLLGTVFLVQAPYRQYFMPFAPLMCGVAAFGILQTLPVKLVKTVVVLAFLVPMILLIRTVFVYPNTPQIDKINWVLEQTSPMDYVYDGKAYFNLYRKDVDYFWYSTEPDRGGLGTYQKLRPYTYNIYRSIELYKPKVISNLFIDNITHPVISQHYEQSKVYEDLYVRVKLALSD